MNHGGDYCAWLKTLFNRSSAKIASETCPPKAKDALQMRSYKWCNNTFLIVSNYDFFGNNLLKIFNIEHIQVL